MRGMKSFVLGFSLSLFSMSVGGQLYSSAAGKTHLPLQTDIKIDLFKTKEDAINKAASDILTKVQKQTITTSVISGLTEKPSASAPDKADSFRFLSEKELPETETAEIAYAPQDINGIEDDEILSVNIDGSIPIEFENTDKQNLNAEIAQSEDENKVAMLPTSTLSDSEDFIPDTPWVVAKGSKHIKNKKLLEKYQDQQPQDLFTDNFKQTANEDQEISYKVAEKIKQSIIFPIPDEILNDENLTPTFIKGSRKTSTPAKGRQNVPQQAKEAKPALPEESVKILPKVSTVAQKKDESKGFLNSISSWFSDKQPTDTAAKPKSKTAPAYSSQGAGKAEETINSNDALVSFYETIQETKQEQAKNKIIPSELKLSFQPDRAEISGQTLRWLKAFSEKAKEEKTYLQIRLDATAPIELQRKRLNLLYTIFMNNGVDFSKVDTVFSLTEPNAFIIRTLQLKQNLP